MLLKLQSGQANPSCSHSCRSYAVFAHLAVNRTYQPLPSLNRCLAAAASWHSSVDEQPLRREVYCALSCPSRQPGSLAGLKCVFLPPISRLSQGLTFQDVILVARSLNF